MLQMSPMIDANSKQATRIARVPPWAHPDALRSNNIDMLRFALAALVIFAHSFALPVGSDRTEPLFRFSLGQRSLGGFAVDFFFILSGFLITHSWMRSPEPIGFLRKRALRIYPAFIAASVVGVFLLGPLSSPDPLRTMGSISIAGFTWHTLTLRAFSVDGAFANNPFAGVINGSLWSIQYEFWCYIGVMLLGLAGLFTRRRAIVLGAFLVAMAGSFAYEALDLRLGGGVLGRVFGSPRLWARLLPCYLAGMVFYLYRDVIRWHAALFFASALLLVVACRTPHGMAVASPTAGAYVLFALAFARRLPCKNFGRFGDFSYGLYVYAFPIQQLLVAWLGPEVNTWKLFGLSLAATLAAAIPSWHLIERPALKLKSSQRRSALTAATAGMGA